MAVHEVVFGALPLGKLHDALAERLKVTALGGLVGVQRPRRYLHDARAFVDGDDLRAVGVGAAREDVHPVAALHHLAAELADVHVQAAAIASAGASERGCMEGDDGDITHWGRTADYTFSCGRCVSPCVIAATGGLGLKSILAPLTY